MTTAGGTAASRTERGRLALRRDAAHELTAGDVAWLVALPCAALVAAAIVLLGPALGRLLFPHASLHFWPVFAIIVRPEPTEQARYLIALGAPLLVSAATLAAVRRHARARLAPATVVRLVAGVQALGLLLVVACIVNQRAQTYGPLFTGTGSSSHTVYFTLPTLLVACAIAAVLALAAREPVVRTNWRRLCVETRPRRAAAALLAVLAVGVWLLPAIELDDTIMGAHPVVAFHAQFSLDDPYAVLDGRSPLVDFAAHYGSLWPYVIAAGMALLGSSLGTLTLIGCVISGLALLGLFGVLRRVTRSSLAALALFLPLLATSGYMMRGPLEDRYAVVNLFSAFPLRYAGPLLVAWLVARQLDGPPARRAWPLFLAAGLTLLNNADFGVPALGASVAALAWTARGPWRTVLRRQGLEALAGLAAALALVSLLTLARAGSLPHLALLFRYSRLFAVAGYGMLPIRPTLGMPFVVYLTAVAAVVTATVRALQGSADRVLTGMLAWSGIFCLGAGAYYVGRSSPEVLTNLFAAWGLCLTLLAIAALRAIARTRRVTIAQLACLAGLGVMTCSLAQVPTPWSQLERLRTKELATLREPQEAPFVAERTHRGESVALLMQFGHRLAHGLGLNDVAPYPGSLSIATVEQLDETVAALRATGGHKLFLSGADTTREVVVRLEREGFRRAGDDAFGTHLLIDRRGRTG
jgi:hypothetical protein